MLIAFISDIHGNLPALQAAVADARKRGATEIVCAGDLTGYGPFPKEVCDYLEKNSIISISGNYDRKVLEMAKRGESAMATLPKDKRKLIAWTVKHIGKNARRFLAGLPENFEMELPGGRKLLVVHGSPASDDDDIYPSLTANGLKAKLGDRKLDVLVCGHTHIPFVKRVSGVLVVNCGSAGHPVDGDPNPSYALVSADEETAHGSVIRFEYNVAETLKALKKTSLPKGLRSDFAGGTKRRFL
jgi:putative phosphoesterase